MLHDNSRHKPDCKFHPDNLGYTDYEDDTGDDDNDNSEAGNDDDEWVDESE
jgi:hypothetical protein